MQEKERAVPVMRPRCCLRCFTLFGINICVLSPKYQKDLMVWELFALFVDYCLTAWRGGSCSPLKIQTLIPMQPKVVCEVAVP